jgi:hypothetical protein
MRQHKRQRKRREGWWQHPRGAPRPGIGLAVLAWIWRTFGIDIRPAVRAGRFAIMARGAKRPAAAVHFSFPFSLNPRLSRLQPYPFERLRCLFLRA